MPLSIRIKPYWLVILWSIIIFLLCLLPGTNIPLVPILGIDKIIHLLIFGLLTHLYLVESNKRKKNLRSLHVILWLFVFVLYGIVLEWYQGRFVTNRIADINDGIANFIGVISSYCIHTIIKR